MSYFTEQLEKAQQRVPKMEYMLGKGLLQPFNNTNSGSRKIMHGTHRDHVFPLLAGEKAICETGFEIRFGDESSSVTAVDGNYEIVAKISKFSRNPNHHYYLIVKDEYHKKLDMIERISYHYITECYGYLYNNSFLDSSNIGDRIPEGTIVQKSLAFDEYNNRRDGINMNVAYLALDDNQEDSILVSESAAKRLTAPLIKIVSVMINENNIPLNLYGNENLFKCCPDIGEDIKDSILIALRKDKKEESVFTESVDRLRKIMMSDEKKQANGKVIDINIYCNNPENLNQYHNSQFKMYYDELQRMSQEVVSTVTRYELEGYEIGYDLGKLFATSKRVLNHDQYNDKKPFSNIIMEFVLLEENPLNVGDKLSNRFGGKGVTSKIIPDALMPTFGPDQERVDIILNRSGVYNRQNIGQVFELAINHVSHEILKKISMGNMSMDECYEEILKFLEIVVPEQAEDMRYRLYQMDMDSLLYFLESMIQDQEIHYSTLPITDSFDIDRLKKLYDTFPYVDHMDFWVNIKDSNGNYRRVKARRKVIAGKEYIFRLKQFAEEKFSANSLSATNIRGENTKSKANKNYYELHSNTPIRVGNMEANDLLHGGVETLIETMMIQSLSPQARKLTIEMYTGDPFHIDIQLDKESTNRSAEIVATYLKAIGKRLRFIKVPKHHYKFVFHPLSFIDYPIKKPIGFLKEDGIDWEEYYKEEDELAEAKKKNPGKKPLKFYAIDKERYIEQQKINQRALEEKGLTPRERYEKFYKGKEDKEGL